MITKPPGINIHFGVQINMSQIAHWSPDRISSFFTGIAQVLAVTPTQSRSPASADVPSTQASPDRKDTSDSITQEHSTHNQEDSHP